MSKLDASGQSQINLENSDLFSGSIGHNLRVGALVFASAFGFPMLEGCALMWLRKPTSILLRCIIQVSMMRPPM